jgi:hypothetical protein
MKRALLLVPVALLGLAACGDDTGAEDGDDYPCDYHMSRGPNGASAEITCEGGEYQDGYVDGVEKGRVIGRSEGYDEGHAAGIDEGYADGYDDGSDLTETRVVQLPGYSPRCAAEFAAYWRAEPNADAFTHNAGLRRVKDACDGWPWPILDALFGTTERDGS